MFVLVHVCGLQACASGAAVGGCGCRICTANIQTFSVSAVKNKLRILTACQNPLRDVSECHYALPEGICCTTTAARTKSAACRLVPVGGAYACVPDGIIYQMIRQRSSGFRQRP